MVEVHPRAEHYRVEVEADVDAEYGSWRVFERTR